MGRETPLREEEHRVRSIEHRKVGDVLVESGLEWGAVPYFYSAYHLIKAAMLRDPIWEQPTALSRIHVDLMPDDKFTERHHGRLRRGEPREWGVNELVLKLYAGAMRSYEQLHQASIKVRYGTGLAEGTLVGLVVALDSLEEMAANGGLEAPLNWPTGGA